MFVRVSLQLDRLVVPVVSQTSVTDVLHAMGAVPSGFRDSTLAKKATSGEFFASVIPF